MVTAWHSHSMPRVSMWLLSQPPSSLVPRLLSFRSLSVLLPLVEFPPSPCDMYLFLSRFPHKLGMHFPTAPQFRCFAAPQGPGPPYIDVRDQAPTTRALFAHAISTDYCRLSDFMTHICDQSPVAKPESIRAELADGAAMPSHARRRAAGSPRPAADWCRRPDSRRRSKLISSRGLGPQGMESIVSPTCEYGQCSCSGTAAADV